MPEQPALSFRGKPPTSAMLVELWTNAEQRFGGAGGRTDRIEKCRDLRRGTETVRIDPTFLREHPEIDPKSAVSLLPERLGYETDLITRAGSVEPQISREPLDVTDAARDQAEAYEAYMRDVAADEESGVPFQTFVEKLAEDGEVGLAVLPSHLDADGFPDFYDRISERAYAALKSEERREYSRDEHDRRGRYVRRDERGNRRPNPTYDRDARGRARKDAERQDGRGSFRRDRDRSTEAHEAAVRRYLLRHAASTFRAIPALDCFPLLGRGKGRQRWTIEGLVERTRFSREELVEKRYGWNMVGNRLVLPLGVSTRHAWVEDDLYLYTAYLMLYAGDDEACPYHPCILYTVGGAGTWWSGWDGDKDAKRDAVAIIDLYDEFKIKHPLWTYEFGSHTSDDDPNYYGHPAIWRFRNRILNIEGLETAAQVAVQLDAYTGHYYKPDADILKEDPEAVVDSATHLLRRPVKPGPGAIEPWAGDVVPFNQARIGDDAWRLQASYQQSLAQNMAVDQVQGDTGHAMLVSASQGQIAKRHIREAALRLFKFCLEADARIRLAAHTCHAVKWPILTSKERPVGHEVRRRTDIAEFDPEWLGEDENVKLTVTYGEEFNLARADLEMNAADRGYRALKHVAAAFGEPDEMNLRVAIAKDQLWKQPESQLLLQEMVVQLRGMKRQQQALRLRMQERMTEQGVPGAPMGVPTAMLKRAGEQAATGGGQGAPMAASIRGGIEGAQQASDAMVANAQGALGQGAA